MSGEYRDTGRCKYVSPVLEPEQKSFFKQSHFSQLWELFLTVWALLSVVSATLLASFDASMIPWIVLLYLADVVHCIRMGTRFVTGYTENGIPVRNFKLISLHYMKTTFCIDFLSILPLEVMAPVSNESSIYYASLLRLNRLLRAYHIWKFLSDQEKGLFSYGYVAQVTRYFFLSGLTVHFQACLWFTLACYNNARGNGTECRENSWANSPQDVPLDINLTDSSVLEQYIASLYWSVATSTTVGYGDVHAVLPLEKLFSIVSMIWGVVIFGYILGGVASTLTNLDAARGQYVHRLEVIKEYLKDSKISSSLFDKVIAYYEYLWLYYRGKGNTNFKEDLPRTLQTELATELYQDVLGKTFKDVPPDFLRLLCAHVQHLFFLPNQMIFETKEMTQCMYFIHNGTVEVINEEDSSVVMELNEGESFGEDLVSTASSVSVHAKTHCNILTLDKTVLHQLMDQFPQVKKENFISFKKENKVRHSSTCTSVVGDFTLLKRIKAVWTSTPPILPVSTFAMIWNYTLLLTVLLVCWLYPFQAGFSFYNTSAGYYDSGLGQFLFFLTYLLDLVFIIDIIVSLKKSYILLDHCYSYERNPKILALTYIKSWTFIFDVLAILPLEIFAPLMPTGSSELGLEWAITWKLNRLLKLWKVGMWFKQLEKSLHYSISKLRTIKFMLYILILTHFSACIWFPLACNNNNRCRLISWATENSINSNTTLFHNYLISFYWAVTTTTTVGYGDITAINSSERVMAISVMLIGVWFYGYVLGSVAAIITHTLLPRVQFHERLHVVQQFMKDNNLNIGLSKRVNDFFWLLWKQHRGAIIPGGYSLLHELPLSLQQDIKLEECSSILSKVPFFSDIHDDYFMKQICHTTVTYLFSSGDIILYYGDMGRQLYCIKKGHVEILSEDLSHVIHSISPGGYFGELGFFFGVPLTATVRASSKCEVFCLSFTSLCDIVKSFPVYNRQLEEIINSRQLLDQSLQLFQEANRTAMLKPPQFTKPSILTALSNAMGPPLAVIYPKPLINAVLASVGSKDVQAQLMAPSLPIKPSLINAKSDKYNKIRTEQEEEGKDMNEQVHVLNKFPCFNIAKRRISTMIDKLLSCCLLHYRLVPGTRMSMTWSILSTILAALVTITIPLQAGYLNSFTISYHIPLWILNYLLDVFFIFDMVLKVHTAYYDSEGILITHPVSCAKKYFKGVFLIDFIGSFPMELIALILWSCGLGPFNRLLSLSRMNRILRCYKLLVFFDYLEDQLPRRSGFVELIKLFVYLLLGTHIIGCIWFLVPCSCLNEFNCCREGSWSDSSPFDSQPLSNYSTGYQYIASLYWATATTTTVGYGDITAHNNTERLFALIVMITGLIFYGTIIANVAASLINADADRAAYQDKLKALKSFMREQKICNDIQNRVIDHYEYVWQRTEGLHFGPLFQGMPPALQTDVSLGLYKRAIDQVPLFKNTGMGFTKLLALSVKPTLYLANEYIVRKGDIGSEMFFINRGSVEVVSENGKIVFAVLNEGKFFGEISLVFNCLRTATIRASTNCDLFVLTKNDFESVLTQFPQVVDQVKEAATNRAYLAILIDEIVTKGKVEGKTAAEVNCGISKVINEVKSASKRGSSIWGRRLTAFFRHNVFHLPTRRQEDVEEENEEEIEREEIGHCCKRNFYSVLWMIIRYYLTTTVSPESTFGRIYSYISCVIVFMSAFTISYQVFFQNNSAALTVVNYFYELYFLVEIFIKLHIGYEDTKRHVTVLDFKSIARRYLKTPSCFGLDLFALLPFEIIAVFLPAGTTVREGVWLYMRLTHIVRILRLKGFFKVQESKLNQRTVLLQILKFTVLISLSTQFVACLWYLLACQLGRCREDSWAEGQGLLTNSSDAYHYLDSVYWAVATMTTVGYGDISASTNVIEMTYAIIIMIAGKLLYGFLLGSVVSTLVNLESSHVIVKDRLDTIKDYMNRKKISVPLQNKVVQHFHYNWLRTEGISREHVMEDMPPCLQAEITLFAIERLIKSVPLFVTVDDCLIRQLSLMLKPCLFLPNKYIIHSGDIGHGLYLIHHGKVSVRTEEKGRHTVLSQGQFFGQDCLTSSCKWSRESVISITHCDLFSLSIEDFKTLLLYYPNLAQQLNDKDEGIDI